MNAHHDALLWRREGRVRPLQLRLALWSGGLLLICNLGVLLLITMFSSEPTINSDGSTLPQLHTSTWPGLHLPVGLTVAAILGGAGTYWLSRKALHRMRVLSRAAQTTSADTLDTRLSLEGPDDEIKELADAFDTMLERLKHAFERQGEFMGDVAHELRTPLATLRTNLEVVAADPDATLYDYQEMSAIAQRSLDRVQRLVDDLLLLATEDQLPASNEVALGPLFQDLLDDLEPVAEERKVKLRLISDTDVVVRGDRELLTRAFGNLVENGIRYNHPDGELEVAITRDGAWAVATISDTGVGMSPEEQARMFDRFYRADKSRSRHKGGAGLGLSIVAKIVHQHGGRVRVESTPGSGSAFTVFLPL